MLLSFVGKRRWAIRTRM